MAQERRTQVFTGPGFDNRPFRKGKTMGFSQKQRADLDMNDPQQFARAMRDMGAKMGPNGEMVPTQNWGGLMGKASQQMNSLSRDARAGEGSGLGGPANTMYDRDPTFFNRGGNAGGAEGFGQMLAQRGQMIKPQPNDTPGAASSAARAGMMKPGAFSGMMKGAIRGFGSPQTIQGAAPAQAPASQAISPQAANRAGLEDRSAGLKLLREMSQTPLQINRQAGGGEDTLVQGKYGSGFAGKIPAGTKRPAGYEGDIGTSGSMRGTRPFSEVMQGLANKQVNEGTWREGDRLPEGMTAEQAKKANEEARQKILSNQRIAAKTK